MSRRVIAPAVALILATSACGSSSPIRHAASDAAPAATAGPEPTPSGGTFTTSEAIPLNSYPGLTGRSSLPGEGHLTRSALAVLPDGALVVSSFRQPPTGPDPQDRIEQSRIEIVGPQGTTIRVPGQDGTLARAAIWAAGNSDTVVWLEVPAQDMPGFALLAYDRRTGTTRVITTSTVFEPFVVAGLGLAEGRVYWVDPKAANPDATRTVYSRDVQAAGPTRRETIPANSVISGGNAFYALRTAADTAIHRRDLRSGSDTVALTVPDPNLRGLAAADDAVAWSSGSTVTLCRSDGTTTRFAGDPQRSLGAVALTPLFLALTDGNDEWLFDRRRDVLVRLADGPGSAVLLGAGSRVVWNDGSTFQEADVSRP